MKSLRLHLVLMALVVCTLAAGQVYLSHARVGVSQQVAMAKATQTLMHQEVQNLKLEVASITRPDALRRLAREKLGMFSPTPMQVVQP